MNKVAAVKFPPLPGLACNSVGRSIINQLSRMSKLPNTIKKRGESENQSFVCSSSDENGMRENPGLNIRLETLHSVNFTGIRVISGTLAELSRRHHPGLILPAVQLDKCDENL